VHVIGPPGRVGDLLPRWTSTTAVGNNIDHPLTVYVRENAVLDPLDTWLAEAFAPHRIKQSLTALENAQPDHTPAVEAAQRAIAECERKLARHRVALEAGADPALVVAWSERCSSNARSRRHIWPTSPVATARTDG
jgi:hypothetical protein